MTGGTASGPLPVRPAGRFYYGWTILLALAFTEVTSWGVLYYSFSVFMAPMQRELGWSRGVLTGAFSLALLASGIAALAVGRWVDRHGPRLLMTAGSVAASLLLVAWANVRNIAALYAVWTGLGLAMAAVLYEPAFVAIATWFRRYRGRALTIITFVGGFASVIYIPVAAWLVETYGWRTAALALAAILAVTTIPPHALLLRRRPSDIGLVPDGSTEPAVPGTAPVLEASVPLRAAVHSASFRWLTTGFCLAFVVNVAVTVHLIPYLLDHGFSTGFAAWAAGLVGVMALPGRLIFTPLGDRVPRRFVTAAIFGVQTIAIATLLLVPATFGVVAFVVLFGLGFGAITPARAALVAEMYGTRDYGGISGVLALFVTGARALAPVSAGLLYTFFGRYEQTFWLLAGVSVLASLAVLLIERDRATLVATSAVVT